MHRNRHAKGLLPLVLLLATLLSGCAALRPEPPEVQLAALQVSDLSLSHANFLATLSLYNPNRSTLDIEGVEFTLLLDQVRVAAGKSTKAISIPAEQSGTATLRLATSFIDLFRLAQRLKGLDEVPFRVTGAVRVGGPGFLWIDVPVDSEGTIPLAGVLGQLFAEPRQFWRQPEKLVPAGTATPDTAAPTGR